MKALVADPDAADVSTNTGRIIPERDFLIGMYARIKGICPEELADTLEYVRTFERRHFLALSLILLIMVSIGSRMPIWYPNLFTAPHGVWVKALMWIIVLVFMGLLHLLSQFKCVNIPKQILSHAFEQERKLIKILLSHVCIDSGLIWLREYLQSAGKDLAPRPYQPEAKDGRDTELSRAVILALMKQRYRMQYQGSLWTSEMSRDESGIYRRGFIAAKALGLIPENATWTHFLTDSIANQGDRYARTNNTVWEGLEKLWQEQ